MRPHSSSRGVPTQFPLTLATPCLPLPTQFTLALPTPSSIPNPMPTQFTPAEVEALLASGGRVCVGPNPNPAWALTLTLRGP